MPLEIEGRVERIVFHNPANGYAVLKLEADGEISTVTGNIPDPREGQYVRAAGAWETHPRFGRQFRAISLEPCNPPTPEAVERYLAAGFVKGIGPAMARRIIEKFGPDCLELIEREPERLCEIPGIGLRKLEGIKKSLSGQREFKETMLALQEYGISPAWSMRVYKCYGRGAPQVLKEDPYRLAEDIKGIGFLTADKIAERTGIPKDSPKRAEAGILYLLGRLSEDGHVFFPYKELLREGEAALGIRREPLLKAIAGLFEKKKIILEPLPSAGIENADEKAVYLRRLHEAEEETAERTRALMSAGRRSKILVKSALEWIERELFMELSSQQALAVEASLKEKVLIITGGPGVGKTTIIKAIVKIYKEFLEKDVLLAAPTGRAAKRLSEVAGQPAKTIHRLLEYSPVEEGFRKNEENPLAADLVILDEASMVDIQLMRSLLLAIPEEAGLIMVGDADQLASVGPGNVFLDMTASGEIPLVRLTEIFRQSARSLIIRNAHRINRGEMPEFPNDKDSDFYFFEREDPQECLEKILELCTAALPARFGLDPVRDIQVLSPMHKGINGVQNLNRLIQGILNKSGETGAFRPGDKVMQLRNNYDKDIFNGDTGMVKTVSGGGVTADFYGREISYGPADLDEIQLAYAASVHKSQGSEYPAIVMPLLTEHYILLQRNLLYTAVTRAKRLAVIVGSRKALGIAIRNAKTQERYTMLARRLRASGPKPI